MIPLFSLPEASALDKRLIPQHHLEESVLIDSAAALVFEALEKKLPGKSVLFLVGKGNNGSDALEVARLALPVAGDVKVILLSEKGNSENLRRRSLLPETVYTSSFGSPDIIVDGLFGFGFHGTVEGYAKDLIQAANGSSAFVLSIDVPSAFQVEADLTVALTTMKSSFFLPSLRAKAGRIVLRNPGFPEDEIRNEGKLWLLEDSDYAPRTFGLSDYKNTRGHLLVAGGSRKYPGAPILTSRSALHAGAGLVTIESVEEVREKVFASYPSLMTRGRGNGDYASFKAIVAGPGWDEGDQGGLCRMVESGKNLVVDADGIKLLPGLDLQGRGVITPHLGEYRRLTAALGIEEEDLFEEVKLVSRRLGTVVVLKSSVVLITDGSSVYVYDGANPSLGVAGSGDVLSGIIGAFLASGMTPIEGAVNGVILHQRAGRTLSERLGWYMAEDLIEEIGKER